MNKQSGTCNKAYKIKHGNFVDHLQDLAINRAQDTAMVVVSERNGITLDSAFNYQQLEIRIRALAAQLQQQFMPNDRALILLENDDQYVVAFFACLYAGLIAVPVFPPKSAHAQQIERLDFIAKDSQPACILTNSHIIEYSKVEIQQFSHAEMIAIDNIKLAHADAWKPHSPKTDSIAFLQYTSGSTSMPKGVMVSHSNLVANEQSIEDGLLITQEDTFVSWLPLFHDMGLIGCMLQSFYRGIKLVLMSPQFFFERPVRWLEAISRHRGTISGGSEFAYRLCVDRIKNTQLEGLDLSSWRAAFIGAEPVRHDTLHTFISRFNQAGFSSLAVTPCYGLAEATLMVSTTQPNASMITTAFQDRSLEIGAAIPDITGKKLVSCGNVVTNHNLSIRDLGKKTSCRDGLIGEIWVSGPSIAKGYWNKPEVTKEALIKQGDTNWLRTGDLGFIYEDNLYFVGRLKDTVTICDHNLYPQDLEQVIENEVSAVRKGRIAVFAIEVSQGEGIGIAAEIPRRLQKVTSLNKLVDELRITVSDYCGESLSVVALLNPGALPKTTSGKLRRSASRQGWLDKSLDAYAIYEYGQFVLGGNNDNKIKNNPVKQNGLVTG